MGARLPVRPDHGFGRILKLLSVVDGFMREALAIECRRRIDANRPVSALERLAVACNVALGFIRCDKDHHALTDWVPLLRRRQRVHRAGLTVAERVRGSFGSRLRDEPLAVELLSCLAEAQVVIDNWRQDYNERRAHSALGMMTPSAFGAGYRATWRPWNSSLRPTV